MNIYLIIVIIILGLYCASCTIAITIVLLEAALDDLHDYLYKKQFKIMQSIGWQSPNVILDKALTMHGINPDTLLGSTESGVYEEAKQEQKRLTTVMKEEVKMQYEHLSLLKKFFVRRRFKQWVLT